MVMEQLLIPLVTGLYLLKILWQIRGILLKVNSEMDKSVELVIGNTTVIQQLSNYD